MILTLIYDIIRIIRRIIGHGVVAVAVEDIVFWIVSALIIFNMTFKYNNGEVRWYIYAGMALGMLLYNRSVSAIFVKYISMLLKYLLKPLKYVMSKLKILLKQILKHMKNVLKPLKKLKKQVKIKTKEVPVHEKKKKKKL